MKTNEETKITYQIEACKRRAREENCQRLTAKCTEIGIGTNSIRRKNMEN